MGNSQKPIMRRLPLFLSIAVVMMVLILPNSVLSQQATGKSRDWQFGLSIYGWFPEINGRTAFSPEGSDSKFKIDIEDILENLEFVLMGALDVRKGSFGVFTDAIYMDLGNSGSASIDGSIGPGAVPTNVTANVDFDMESLIWNLLAYYRAVDKNRTALDIVAGTRYLDVEQKVKWDIVGNVDSVPVAERSGDAKASVSNWDVILGVRGRFGFGVKKTWFIPYYLDAGVGDSDFTWQGVAGLGYAFGWGEIVAAWRYLYYDMPSDKAIEDISFSGPEAGVTFRW